VDAALHAEAKRFLVAIPVFGALPDRAMDKLLELIEVRHHRPGEAVCTEGEPGHELFVVRAGAVEVTKQAPDGQPTCLARLGPGDCFGEMSLIDIQRRSATVVTRAESDIYVLTNRDMHTLWQHDAEGFTLLVMNIARELSRRLRTANGVIAGLFLRLGEYVRSSVD